MARKKKPTKSRYARACCERRIIEWAKTIGNKSGAWKNSFDCTCRRQINPVKVEGHKALLSIDYVMFWYDLETHEYTFFREIGA
jgi:hypothetical protein